MDLIYADAQRIDLGVLFDYKWDLAYGVDENTFTCEVSADNHVCREGYFLYIEGTEYGGVIDEIQTNTSTGTIIYSGRTWHGILEGHVIEPDAGCDYYTANGEGNEVLAEIVETMGLQGLFEVSADDSGVDIVQHQIRYKKGYTAIRKMLFEAEGKLQLEYKRGIVYLSVVPYVDYSQDEEWDSTQLDFEIKRNYRPVNHVICMGKGDLRHRKVIHLFTDENGGVQQYLLTDPPIQDTDYIIDKKNQVLFGEEENCTIYDYPNAGEVENYTLLADKPDNWQTVYINYFMQNDDSFEALESTWEDAYIPQEYKPSDWEVNYTDYFTMCESEFEPVREYAEEVYTIQSVMPSDWTVNFPNYYTADGEAVESVSATVYKKLTKIPNDWKNNYGNYYTYQSDGLTESYPSVSGDTKYKYKPQTIKPSDWATNYSAYYKKKKGGGYEPVTGVVKGKKTVAPTWKAKKYYTNVTYQVAPKFVKNKYYRAETTITSPAWISGKYYTKSIQNVPTWESGKYYTKTQVEIIPDFKPNVYYKRTVDNYAELVKGGLEILQEAYNCDSVNVIFNDNQTYDIGDVVGANDTKTGLATWQPVTKKIVTIQDNQETIDYKIGE